MDRNRIVAGLDVTKIVSFCVLCAMESTAVYWVPVWNELCEYMTLRLANPHFIKQLPGRKSDTKDAQWIAECQLKRLIRESFVSNPVVQDMRKLNRRIFNLNEDLAYNKNKLHVGMQRCGFRLSNYVSNIGGKSYQCLQTIPGVNECAATAIIAETGADMSMFAKATNLVGWCGLKPRNDENNRRIKSNRITHGNRYLRQILIEIAWVASRTRNSFFSNFSYVQVTVKKKRKMKIQVAIARKILVAVWHMLSNEEDFIDIYLKRLEEQRLIQLQIELLESSMAL